MGVILVNEMRVSGEEEEGGGGGSVGNICREGGI